MTDRNTHPLIIPEALARAADIVASKTTPPAMVSDEAVARKVLAMAQVHPIIPAPEYVPAIRDYLSGYGVMLHGKTGTGKTFLMHALGARLWPAADIVDCGFDGLREWYRRTDNTDICIDDLGTEPVRVEYGARDDMMRAVIAHRADRQHGRTCLTTNLTAQQIAARYGDRTLSRLLGMCRPHEITGPNRRTPRQHAAGVESARGAFPVAGKVFDCGEGNA